MKTSTMQRTATVWIMVLGGCNALPDGFNGSGGTGGAGGSPRSLVEDFESDSGVGAGGFATSLFLHDTSAAGSVQIVDETFSELAAPYISSSHALFVATGPDVVTFDLSAGESVRAVSVWVNTVSGPARIEIIGRGDTLMFELDQGVQDWQAVEAASADLGTGGTALGEIIEVRLDGGEAIYDDLAVELNG